MKKLKRLKLNQFSQMDEVEMNNLMGGYFSGSGTCNDPYQLPEVTVYANSGCPACMAGHSFMNDAGYHSASKSFGYILLGVQHLVGCCGHK